MLHAWLRDDLDMGSASLQVASEDASFRRYYRVTCDEKSFIVMDAPPEKEDCSPFLDVSARLHKSGVNVPQVFASDLDRGFLLLSDLGTELYLDSLNPENADRLYRDAMAALLRIQLSAPTENLPPYNETLLLREMQLFRDWLLEKHLGIMLNPGEQAALAELLAWLKDAALSQPQVFVHRDFHSRNLLVTEPNPGIIDYQDAVLGPCTYDLVSLLKDCYIKWPREKIASWLQVFHDGFSVDRGSLPAAEDFKRSFDLMGVQRHLKASGIFARLYHRDGKSAYLKDIPRTLSYILDLQADYPELDGLVNLLSTRVLPGLPGA